jgi:hypothetical protein
MPAKDLLLDTILFQDPVTNLVGLDPVQMDPLGPLYALYVMWESTQIKMEVLIVKIVQLTFMRDKLE